MRFVSRPLPRSVVAALLLLVAACSSEDTAPPSASDADSTADSGASGHQGKDAAQAEASGDTASPPANEPLTDAAPREAAIADAARQSCLSEREGGDAGTIKHRIMFAEYPPGKLVEFTPEGTVFWETNGPSTIFMFNVLPNDDIFFPFAGGGKTGAEVINRKYQVVWTYLSTSQQVGGGERLPNGNTLLGEQGPPRALEIDATGATVAAFPLPTTETRFDHQVRHIHRLPNGNTLAAMEGEGAARELDPKGNVVWEYAAGGLVQDVLRLDCGNTLITTGDQRRIVEITPEGNVAWEFRASDAPEVILTFFTSLQLLKNGNLVVGNWTRAENLPGVHAFEVTHDRAKKVVWKFENHGLLQAGMAVTVLDDK